MATERVQSPRPSGRAYGLSAVGQLFSRDTQAIFYNWCDLLTLLGGGCRGGFRRPPGRP